MKKPIWKLEKRRLEELIPYEFNPRNITKKGKVELKKSIDKFGLAEPIVINLDNVIIGGHARYFVLLEKAEVFCDCYVPSFLLTPKEMKELNIRLNKNIAGEWNFDILANSFELPDLLDWGFEEKELDLAMWNDKTEEQLDDAPEPHKEAISQLGDLFLLNNRHRVLCGDSTNKEDVEKLMDRKKADMVFTDPPYGVSYADKNKYLNSISFGNRIQIPIQNDHLSIDDIADNVIYPAFCQIKNLLNDYSSYYITAPQGGELLMMMMMMMMKAEIPLRHMIIWVKNNHVLGRTDYNYKHEPILYGWINHHKHYGNGEQNFSVWNYDKPLKNDLHPTMKPIKLIQNAVLNSTQGSNNIVADLFLGSGSTLIACEQTNRICYGMEIDCLYVDIIIRRYIKLYPDCIVKHLNGKLKKEDFIIA